jgi:hypothetical protein
MKTVLFALTLIVVSNAFACDPIAATAETARKAAREQGAASVAIAQTFQTDKPDGEPAAIVHYAFTLPDGNVVMGKSIVDLLSCSVERSSFEIAKSIPTN